MVSSSTSRNEPAVNSLIGERDSLARRRYFGEKTTSGLRTSRRIWRRRRWKNCDELVALQTCMLFSAHNERKRSMRPDECSGPCPSYPCGSSSVRPDVCPHLSSAAERNWSTMTCAPLKKSPNCASQHTSASRCTIEYPYSKPMAAYSDSDES